MSGSARYRNVEMVRRFDRLKTGSAERKLAGYPLFACRTLPNEVTPWCEGGKADYLPRATGAGTRGVLVLADT